MSKKWEIRGAIYLVEYEKATAEEAKTCQMTYGRVKFGPMESRDGAIIWKPVKVTLL